jgi:hypothetical protein
MIYIEFVGEPLDHEPRFMCRYNGTGPVKFGDVKSAGLVGHEQSVDIENI